MGRTILHPVYGLGRSLPLNRGRGTALARWDPLVLYRYLLWGGLGTDRGFISATLGPGAVPVSSLGP